MTNPKLTSEKESVMVNSHIKDAALAVVRGGGMQKDSKDPVAVTRYPGMFVSKSGDPNLQAIHFFEEDGVKYALGPLRN